MELGCLQNRFGSPYLIGHKTCYFFLSSLFILSLQPYNHTVFVLLLIMTIKPLPCFGTIMIALSALYRKRSQYKRTGEKVCERNPSTPEIIIRGTNIPRDGPMQGRSQAFPSAGAIFCNLPNFRVGSRGQEL